MQNKCAYGLPFISRNKTTFTCAGANKTAHCTHVNGKRLNVFLWHSLDIQWTSSGSVCSLGHRKWLNSLNKVNESRRMVIFSETFASFLCGHSNHRYWPFIARHQGTIIVVGCLLSFHLWNRWLPLAGATYIQQVIRGTGRAQWFSNFHNEPNHFVILSR